MNKKLLLILLVPMALMGMREPIDPRSIHSASEEPMYKQAYRVIKKRIRDNVIPLAVATVTIGYAAFRVFYSGNLSPIAIPSASPQVIAFLDQQAARGSAVGVLSASLDSVVYRAPTILENATTALSAAGKETVALVGAGAFAIGQQTLACGCDVYTASQQQKASVALKENAIQIYDAQAMAKQARQAEERACQAVQEKEEQKLQDTLEVAIL